MKKFSLIVSTVGVIFMAYALVFLGVIFFKMIVVLGLLVFIMGCGYVVRYFFKNKTKKQP